MLIAVVSLGSAILGATTIAGFLMVYQIRQSTDFVNSAKAIFAADAGIEWARYSYYQSASTTLLSFGNGATSTVTCDDGAGNTLPCSDGSSTEAISEGTAANAARAFLLQLQ